ncbi:MAG: CinA family protein [Gammaproteobacteria bacterium]
MTNRAWSDDHLSATAEHLGSRLKASGRVLATAESCTGGWIAKVLTDIPGSSDWFGYGIVSYSNQAKQELLDVPIDVLIEHGAVSEAVVRAMAEGAIRHGDADLAVSVSGIAGPDGGTEDKPVGTVWFAWAVLDDEGLRSFATEHRFAGGRDEVRRQTVLIALERLLEL